VTQDSVGPAGIAFVTAALVALVATPRLRRLALDVDFVDRPGAHKSHHVPVPYLGGVAIIAATLAGTAVAAVRPDPTVVLLVGAATAVGALGLLDDDRMLLPAPRLLVQLGAALVAVAVGTRIEISGIWVYDTALTIVWILGVTNAVNFLDNMDGLASGIGAVAATALFTVAIVDGQTAVAVIAAALVGSCLGFLPFNVRPAGIYMGDAGSLFIGFVLAVLALEVRPDLTPPASFVVPMLLLALPVLDIAMVTLSRLRRRIPVSTGGRNHLSHRLVARGLSPGTAVGVLIGVEASTALLAIAATRDVISVTWAVLLSAVILGGLVATTVSAPVFDEPPVGFSRRLKVLAGVAVAGVVVLTTPASAALFAARTDLGAGSRATLAALGAARRGDEDESSRKLEQAVAAFARAEDRLAGPLVTMGLIVPVVNVNVQASRALATVGSDLSRSATALATATDHPGFRVVDGAVPLRRLDRMAPMLADTAAALRGSSERLRAVNRPLLVPMLEDRLRSLTELLPDLVEHAERSESAAWLLPGMLGAEGPRQYLVVVEDRPDSDASHRPVELLGVLGAADGRTRLAPLGAPAVHHHSLFAHGEGIASKTGFPALANSLVRASSGAGASFDGVIAVDQVGLEALAHLAGRPDLLSGTTPERGDDRATGSTTQAAAIIDAVTTADLGSPSRITSTMGDSIADGHVKLFFVRPEEQALAERLGAAGTAPRSGRGR
jgi:UDP-GlcNAc:undecaprenyl-phosphate GlcNAc-1-phosphate transferase